jgi:hypothetical protein
MESNTLTIHIIYHGTNGYVNQKKTDLRKKIEPHPPKLSLGETLPGNEMETPQVAPSHPKSKDTPKLSLGGWVYHKVFASKMLTLARSLLLSITTA